MALVLLRSCTSVAVVLIRKIQQDDLSIMMDSSHGVNCLFEHRIVYIVGSSTMRVESWACGKCLLLPMNSQRYRLSCARIDSLRHEMNPSLYSDRLVVS